MCLNKNQILIIITTIINKCISTQKCESVDFSASMGLSPERTEGDNHTSAESSFAHVSNGIFFCGSIKPIFQFVVMRKIAFYTHRIKRYVFIYIYLEKIQTFDNTMKPSTLSVIDGFTVPLFVLTLLVGATKYGSNKILKF